MLPDFRRSARDGYPPLHLPYAQRRELLEALDPVPGAAGAALLHRLHGRRRAGGLPRPRPGGHRGQAAGLPVPARQAIAGLAKVKNVHRQEVVVGGWKPGEGNRAGQIGSLLVGVYGPRGLDYAGHVGTGFTQQTSRLLGARLAALQQPASPFADEVPREHARGAIWVQPRLVIDVAFAVWTPEGRLRAASYQGLRDDKIPPRSSARPEAPDETSRHIPLAGFLWAGERRQRSRPGHPRDLNPRMKLAAISHWQASSGPGARPGRGRNYLNIFTGSIALFRDAGEEPSATNMA